MSSSTPFLIGRGLLNCAVAPSAGTAIAASTNGPPAQTAVQVAVSEDFRNSRRDGWPICTLLEKPACQIQLTKRKLCEFIQVDLRIPLVLRLHDFVPRDFVFLIRRRARHHAGKRRLAAFGCL